MSFGNCGYNIGAIYLDMYHKLEEHSGHEKQTLLNQLKGHNSQLKDISRLIQALTERKSKGDADFNNEPEFMELIDRIRESSKDQQTHQSVLPPHTYRWNDERTIEIVLQGLNDEVKIISGDVNQLTMQIQQNYQDMHSFSETTRKSIELIIEEIRSIQRRTGN